MTTKLWIFGGFLGAGKTTMLLNLSRRLLEQGRRVGIVTNGQGGDLVDTAFLAGQGLPVYDVEGGCFCCHFDQLVDRLEALRREQWPDVILAEPVGSSVNLVASLFKPLQAGHLDRFDLAPLTVVVDPLRLARWGEHAAAGALTGIDQLFEKQLEEADILFINKADTLAPERAQAYAAFLADRCPGAQVLAGSARQGDGLDALMALLAGSFADRPALAVDRGKLLSCAAIHWCNLTLRVEGCQDPPALARAILEGIRDRLPPGAELPHAKLHIAGEQGSFKASLTRRDGAVETLGAPTVGAGAVHLLVNVFADVAPAPLDRLVRRAVSAAVKQAGAAVAHMSGHVYAPGRLRPR